MRGLLDNPLFIYFGAAAFLSLAFTVFLGFNMPKFGFKKHRFFALLTLALALLHILSILVSGYFLA